MKRILLACVALGVSGASAAELATPQLYRPTPVVSQRLYEWTGLYFGINAGYGWGDADSAVIFTGALPGGTTTPFGLGATELTGTTLAGTGRLSGGLAGGQAGFNFQSGGIVLGGELDAQWSGQRGSFTVNCSTGCAASLSPRIKSVLTARARLGYAFDGIMPYVTAGGAVVNVADDLTMTVAGVSATFPSMPATVLGWVANISTSASTTSRRERRYPMCSASAPPRRAPDIRTISCASASITGSARAAAAGC